MMEWIKFILCLWLCVSNVDSIDSFYGQSFLFESMKSRPQVTTVVSLHFYTTSPDGTLLLAIGHSQYLRISLVHGRIQVQIDLGYGEEVLVTPEDKALDNLLWHQLKVIRSGRNIKLVLGGVDVDTGQIRAPGRSRPKFDVDFGIFVGGVGGNVTIPDGSRPKFFRGCLLEAKFNGQDLLSLTKTSGLKKIVSNVFLGCSTIFSSSPSEPLTFDSPSSYIALRRWTPLDNGNFECMLKTKERNGVILYNAGRNSGEFIVLEMVDGVLGASVNKGGGVVGLRTTSPINDGSWHTVKFSFSPSILDIRVDGNRTKTFFEQQNSLHSNGAPINQQHRSLELAGNLYVGGIPQDLLRSGTIPPSLLSLSIVDGKAIVGNAFPGCVRHIRVNHRRKSFGDFISTHKVSSGCSLGHFSDDESTGMTFSEASNAVSELYAFYFNTPVSTTTTTKMVTTTQTTTTTTPAFVLPTVTVSIQPLNVLEGDSAVLTKYQISCIIVPGSLNVTDKDLLLVKSNQEENGKLSSSCDDNVKTIQQFSMADIVSKSLVYCHDGSETVSDHIQFSVVLNLAGKSSVERKLIASQVVGKVEFISAGFALNGGKLYDLPIVITPVDDAPELEIPLEYLFRPVKNVPTHFSKFILNATDPDSNRSQIIYSVLGSGESDDYSIENDDFKYRSITEFTQEDIDLEKITFTHKGNRDNARLFLRLFNPSSDESYPQQKHNSAVLRFAAQPLNISTQVKTLDLLEKSSVLLTDDYISISSNAELNSVRYVCDIESKPTFGVLEIRGPDGQWSETSNFTQENMANGVFRYRNTERTALKTAKDRDSFSFSVSAAAVRSPATEFIISVEKVNVVLKVGTIVLRNGIQEAMLLANNMNVSSENFILSPERTQMRLKASPKHMDVFFNDNNLILGSEDTFTVEELKKGRVSLRVKAKFAARGFQELVPFEAVVDDVYMSSVQMMNVTYVPDLDRVVLVMKELKVEEGKQQSIGIRTLKASLPPSPINDKIKRFRFRIVRPPGHGVLGKTDGLDDGGTRDISEFLSSDLEKNAIFYRHDNSESTTDSFTFNVTPVLEGQLPETVAKLSAISLEANFLVIINPVNDQKPVRVVSRDFEIVRNGERLLTKDDLWYHDEDSNFDDGDLIVRTRGITVGELLNATSRRHEKIKEFRQRQVLNGEVLYKHRGTDNGRFVFFVRDGKHYVPGLVIISASDPYLRITNSTAVTVIKGSDIAITNSHLGSETNIKGLQEDIIYKITSGPTNGLLYLNTSTPLTDMESVSAFTQKDINDGRLVYEHSGSPVMTDEILFTVSAGEISKTGNITVKVFLESHSKPPSVQKNRTITVAEGQKVEIRKQDLRVVHPDAKAADILFTITESPRFGNLVFLSDVESDEFNSHLVTEFTQADINHGSVWYAQNGSVEYSADDFINGLLLDSFSFNVTNKILTQHGLRFFFDVIPNEIPLRIANFSVREGKSKAMIHDYLWIEGNHFNPDNVEVRIVSLPSHGIFESTQHTGVALKSFSFRLAVEEFLYYAHDGSDFLYDNFSLQAVTVDGQKRSEIVDGFVNVIPVNDETPVIVNNTGLNVWTGSVTIVPPSALAAFDPDSPPGELRFRILPASNGYIALSDDPSTPILNFTQENINDKMIVFVHSGTSTGGFTFQCDDGLNYANKRIFVVTARPLIISVDKPGTLQAFPGAETLISDHVLSSTTNDPDIVKRMITYTVTTHPSYGKLIKKDGVYDGKVTNFTQQDINDGIIYYYQNVEVEKWTVTDSFVLVASSPPAEDIHDVKVAVNITYHAIAGRSPVRVNTGQIVVEGGKVVINQSSLDASNLFKKLPFHKDKKHYQLIYSLQSIPLHGNLSISGKNVTKVNTTFSQSELESDRIKYTHDHSDTLMDTMLLRMYLVDKRFSTSTGSYWVVPGTLIEDHFNISIIPLNDNPPVLLTKGKVLNVVDGYQKMISSDFLNAIDPDSLPSEIVYSVLRRPSKGRIVYVHDKDTPLKEFTQKDVTDEKVLFIPSLLNLTKSEVRDVFYFGVTDGIQRPAYNLFQIKIHPVYIKFSTGAIEILQGTFSTVLSTKILNISTNGNLSLVSVEVTEPGQTGVILVNEQKSDSFTYEDLMEERVAYTLTSNEFPNDIVKFKAIYLSPSGNNLNASGTVKVLVKPLMENSDLFPINRNGFTRIDSSMLNASALLDKVNSMPVYNVLEKPAFAELFKLSPNEDQSRVKRDLGIYSTILLETEVFTHEDVAHDRMYLYINSNSTQNSSSSDSIRLRLTVEDQTVPPADFTIQCDIADNEAEDFAEYFGRFLPREQTTASEIPDSPTIAPSFAATKDTMRDSEVLAVTTPVANIAPRNENGLNKLSSSAKPREEETHDPKVNEAAILWWIPVAIVSGVIILLVIMLVVICLRRKSSSKKSEKSDEESEENSALTKQESFQVRRTENSALDQQTNSSRQPLCSPACPGVTVTLLQRDSIPDPTELLLPSLFDRIEDAPSYLSSAIGPNSIRGGNQSTIYDPSTIYRYDDNGSMDFTDVPETEYYAANAASYPSQRLYHAKSDKYIDPDVLALYSSDESIPSMLDEKYAVSYCGTNALTGSVPSGLHRTTSQHSAAEGGIPGSRSAASLNAAIGHELSLPSKAGLESNQYWI